MLTDNFWGRVGNNEDDSSFIVRELSGRELFHATPSVPNVAADAKTKWLLDAYKIPVTHMAEVRTYTTAYNVYIGKDTGYCLTQIEVKYTPMHNNPCKAETQNLDTGDRSRVGVHGLWRQRTVSIYLDRENNDGCQAIAKVFRPDMTMSGDWRQRVPRDRRRGRRRRVRRARVRRHGRRAAAADRRRLTLQLMPAKRANSSQ